MSTKLRKLGIVSALFALAAGSLLAIALHQESTARSLRDQRLAGSISDYSSEAGALRIAGFCRAGAVLAAAFYLLGLGVLFAPAPLHLIAGNLALLLALLVLVDAASQLLGVHLSAIGRPGEAGDFGLWVYDETKGWFHAPSATAESYFGGPDRGRVRINRLGLRGPEIGPKLPGTTRVLVFGDSYVFGVGVDEENIFTSHLERLLEPSFPGGIEVVNLGVSGYSTDQEYLLWQELGPGLEPDSVILVVCDNDYLGNTENFAWRQYYKPFFAVDENGELELQNVPVPRLDGLQRAKLWLGRESNLWNLAASRQSENPSLQAFWSWFRVDVPRRPRAPHRTMRALVKAFARDVEATGARFLVTSTGRRAEDPSLFQNLAGFLSGEGIDHLDLFPILHAARLHQPERLWDFPKDTHWNRDAHELAARSLVEHLRERYLESGSRAR